MSIYRSSYPIKSSNEVIINLIKDYSSYPAGPKITDGPFSGEGFRKDFLEPALQKSKVKIVIDRMYFCFASSWLKEAFGPLKNKFLLTDLRNLLTIESEDDPTYIDEIWEYIENT